MGRKTIEVVLGFGIDWPYRKPVYVVSNTLCTIPSGLEGNAFLINGTLSEILSKVYKQGHHKLYIDRGSLIQSFLREDLIDEMVITTNPVLLGDGLKLFADLPKVLEFECVETKHFLEKVVQSRYIWKREAK